MLPLESPLDAYRSDLRRNPGRSDFGSADTVWLLVAHCLQRLGRAAAGERDQVAASCAAALNGLVPMLESGEVERDTAAEIGRFREGLTGFATAEGTDAVCRSARALTTLMTNAGALSLAFSAIGHLRIAAATASPREQGLNLTEQGYIARALGDLDGAEELYRMAVAAVADRREVEVRVRSHLGRGVVARMRGNYPAARQLFQLGLAEAEEACRDDLAAVGHQALLIAAAVAGDLDTALVHGWAAYTKSDDPVRRVEMLINLSQLALEGGHPTAALQGFLTALGLTPVPHYRLAACGGIAVAAARLGRRKLVDAVGDEIEKLLVASGMPYVNAQALTSLWTATRLLGDLARAEILRLRVRQIAKAGGFFELFHKTDEAGATGPERPAARALAKPSTRIIASLERLEPAGSEHLLAARI